MSLDGREIGRATTDNYGAFLIDKLEPGREYTLTLEGAGYQSLSVPVKLGESVTLGALFLRKAGRGRRRAAHVAAAPRARRAPCRRRPAGERLEDGWSSRRCCADGAASAPTRLSPSRAS